MIERPRRSALYVPGDNARALEKARGLDCDVVIIDLEDAVAPDAKVRARVEAMQTLSADAFGEREPMVRVNGLDTPWGEDDLSALRGQRPCAILLPKVSTTAELESYLERIDPTIPVWIMIETCKAVMNLGALAQMRATTALRGLVVGTNDLAREMRCRIDPARTALSSALTSSVVAARAWDLGVLDGVFNDVDDDEGFESQARQGRALGFDGKTLIHPRQIEAANRAFSPTDQEVAHSRKIVAAFADPANVGRGVLRLDGVMIERLHLDIARSTLAFVERMSR